MVKRAEGNVCRGISVGGSILTWGEKPNGTKWNVAVTDPFDPDTYIGTLQLPGGVFVSTSPGIMSGM